MAWSFEVDCPAFLDGKTSRADGLASTFVFEPSVENHTSVSDLEAFERTGHHAMRTIQSAISS